MKDLFVKVLATVSVIVTVATALYQILQCIETIAKVFGWKPEKA